MALAAKTISNLLVSDVSGQKTATIDNVPADATVGDLMASVLSELKLPKNDQSGRPLVYQPLNQTAGRHLNVVEKVGEAVSPDDHIVLHPDVSAGYW
jgi:hypothetical protein